MCMLCGAETIGNRHPWPVPVRPYVVALQTKLPEAQKACHVYRSPVGRNEETSRTALVQAIDSVYASLAKIDKARDTWWASKKQMRETLREQIQHERATQNFKAASQGEKERQAERSAQERYNELQAINARAVDMFIEMRNRVDMIVRSTLQLDTSSFGSRQSPSTSEA